MTELDTRCIGRCETHRVQNSILTALSATAAARGIADAFAALENQQDACHGVPRNVVDERDAAEVTRGARSGTERHGSGGTGQKVRYRAGRKTVRGERCSYLA